MVLGTQQVLDQCWLARQTDGNFVPNPGMPGPGTVLGITQFLMSFSSSVLGAWRTSYMHFPGVTHYEGGCCMLVPQLGRMPLGQTIWFKFPG